MSQMGKFVIRNGCAVRVQTLPVTNCDNCGACCMHMGTPPGYAMFYARDGVLPEYALQSPDYHRWSALPQEIKGPLDEYYRAMKSGEIEDRTKDFRDTEIVAKLIREGKLKLAGSLLQRIVDKAVPIPCLWFDEETKRCRHYEHRPETCRDAIEPGDSACLSTRRRFRIPLPVAK